MYNYSIGLSWLTTIVWRYILLFVSSQMWININAFHFCVYVMLVSIICPCSIFDRQRMLTAWKRNAPYKKKYVYIYVAKITKKFVKGYTLYFYVSVQESLSLSFSMFSQTYEHNMPCRQCHRIRITLFRVRVDFCVVDDATSIIYTTKGYLIKMYMYGII